MMGFWARLSLGLELAARVLTALLTLEAPGAVIVTPEVRLLHEGRVFWISVNVRRAS